MTDIQQLDKDLDWSKQWCGRCRELLQKKGLKAALPGANKASDEMRDRIAAVADLLRGMARDERMRQIPTFAPLFERFRARLLAITARGKQVAQAASPSLDEAKAVSQDLELLQLEITQHIGNAPAKAKAGDTLASRRGALVEKSVEAFTKAALAATAQIDKAATVVGVPADRLATARGILRTAKERVAGLAAGVTADTATAVNQQIEAQTALLAGIGAELQAAKVGAADQRSARQRDLAAVPAYKALLRSAEDARMEIEGLEGAREQFLAIERLLGDVRAKVTTVGELLVGCAAAVPVLEGVPAILAAARAANQTYQKRPFPAELQPAIDALSAQIGSLREVAPDHQVAGHVAARSAFVKRGKDGEAAAALRVEIQQATAAMRAERGRLAGQRMAAQRDLARLETVLAGVDAQAHGRDAVAAALQRVRDDLFVHREWRRASEAIAAAAAELVDVRGRFQHAGEWTRVRAEIERMLAAFPTAALAFGATAPQAAEVSLLLRDLRDTVARTGDYAGGVRRFAESRVAERFAQLQRDTADLPAGDALQAFQGKKQELEEKVDAARTAAAAALANVARRLRGVADVSRTPYQSQIDAAFTAWRSGSVAARSLPELQAAGNTAERALASVAAACQRLLTDKAELARFQALVQAEEAQRTSDDRPRHIGELLDRLAASGEDVAPERTEWQQLRQAAVRDEAALVALERRVVQRLDARRDAAAAAADGLRARAAQLQKQLGKAGIPLDYKPAAVALANECKDLEELAASGDPELIASGATLATDLERRLAALGGGGAYKAVETRIRELSASVGDGDLRKYLPDTQRRVYGELQAAIVAARRAAPAAALALLEAVAPSITQALAAAQRAVQDHQAQKARRAEFDALWKEVRKKAPFALTKRPIETFVEARLAEYEAALRQEGGAAAAGRILDALFTKLRPLQGKDTVDARVGLGELDQECAAVEAHVVRLAKQFHAELDDFNKNLFQQVVEHAKTHEADRDAARSLLAVAKSAKDIVKPYLKLLKTLPHQKRGAEPAPESAKLQADFARARGMLAEGVKSARRMLGMSSTTNVVVEEDFGKLEANWKRQVRAYNANIERIASQLTQAEKELSAGADPIDEATRTRIQQAARAVEAAGTIFTERAFARPFAVLAGDAAPPAKAAAREVALRTMRRLRLQLLKNPLLVQLADVANPFDGNRMKAAAGTLRAALKRIELEALIGV